MHTIHDTFSKPLRAYLVAVKLPDQDDDYIRELLDELAELALTFGAEVVDTCVIKISKPQARYLIGSGNAQKISEFCAVNNIDLIIFDHDVSPTQQRNWEQLSKIRVIDRHEVILDIFAARASTREAVLQIELAKSQYLLPRLKNAWTHLSRQQGGVGVRGGEGEKQIEVDERLVRKKLTKLKEELRLVQKRRIEQRKSRIEKPEFNAAIIGYTNAGKSSLLNCLTNAHTLVEDKLFATLDPTTRRIQLKNKQTLLLTDTVGFIRNLPHDLIEAFKSTLEEAVMATFHLHLVDITSQAIDDHIQTTHNVLKEIGAEGKEEVLVFNKVDLVADNIILNRMRRKYPDALFISTKTGAGIAELLDRLIDLIYQDTRMIELKIPFNCYHLITFIRKHGSVMSERFEPDAIYLTANLSMKALAHLTPYLVTAPNPIHTHENCLI